IAATVAERDDVLVEGSAAMAQHIAQVERIGHDGGAASRIPASGTQVVQPFEVAALALPVSNGVIDELELAQAPKIGDRENALEDALEPGVIALLRKQIHLQEALVRFFLDLDQVRDRDGCLDFREIDSLPSHA